MANLTESSQGSPCWFVGAAYGKKGDQTERFVAEGIWENGYKDRHLDLVRSIKPGDRIALKSSYTRKHELPFENAGQTVSVMAIKAVGTVTGNSGDGRVVQVDWTHVDSPREWYFYTFRGTIWQVVPGDWKSDALVAFTFHDTQQDYSRFRNAPYWRERFGDVESGQHRFRWTKFYDAMADGLLGHREDRSSLVGAIHEIASRHEGLSHLQDKYSDGSTAPLEDICPFTAMGIFNRGITEANRKAIAGALAQFLDVTEPVPESFEGIPVLNNQRSWFFGHEKSRGAGDIDKLWRVFAAGLMLDDSDDNKAQTEFVTAFDDASSCYSVAWNLTFGLYWARPWQFLSLDKNSRNYLVDHLNVAIGKGGLKSRCSGTEYLDLVNAMKRRFDEDDYPVHSFPELSLAAWQYEPLADPALEGEDDAEDEEGEPESAGETIATYSVANIVEEGSFFSHDELEAMVRRLRMKKNLILQGPPGTGKTWLAKKLAYALMGKRDEGRVRAVQFHPNLSYEDFVRGWRPSGDGKLDLVDGPFLQMIKAAKDNPEVKSVLVIEEVNRGNPAQIFGEMLTLLEADKRTPSEALELCYRRDRAERVFVPSNLYVVGTMNIADRSLALVDLALRRRFAFVDLEPRFGSVWQNWVAKRCGIDKSFLSEVEQRIRSLNDNIAADRSLGPQFRIGHSYVTPSSGMQIEDGKDWFQEVVRTEIGPLLEEYWFDAASQASEACEQLVKGL